MTPPRRLKYCCVDSPEYGLNVSSSDYQTSGVRLLRTSDISDRGTVKDGGVFISEDIVEERHVLRDGDLLFSRSGTLGRCCRVRQQDLPLTFAGYLVRFRPADDVDPRYLEYCSHSTTFQQAIEADAVTSTISNFNAERYGSLGVPSRRIAEQRRIVWFLDAETERIDELIATKARMIDRSRELRQSVTYEAVAGSLRAASENARRASSIPWLSTIPSEWREASLRLVAVLGSGHTPSRSHPEWWVDCKVPWVTTGEVARLRSDRHEYIHETRECVSELGLANSSAVVHPAETVVLCRTSASAGYSGIMAEDMATSQDFATWTCGPLLRPRFLLLCLRAMRRDLLERLGQGSTHVTIYMPDIESIRVPLPPVDEQDRIVDEAWRRMNALAKAEDVLRKQVELLKERRRSLITAAVSGEMGVP